MHLKNFSLLTSPENETTLAPAYDLVSTRLALPADNESMALTINAKRRKLNKSDFDSLAASLNIPQKAMENSYHKLASRIADLNGWIDISFLPPPLKKEYKRIIAENAKKIW